MLFRSISDLADTIIQEFKERFKKNDAPESVQKAFGAVASNIRSLRGKAVFDFLADALEKDDTAPSIKEAAANSLSTTNLPQAAEVLAKHFLTIPGCREALIRMGELAVPALAKECEGENAIPCVLALREIGTPSAAEALVPLLGESRNDIALSAAYSLGNLMESKGVEEALRNYRYSIPTHQGTLDWVWAPFNEPENSSLRKICGRIAFILSNAQSIPDYLQDYELDPRFSIPLSIDSLSDEAYNAVQKFRFGYSSDIRDEVLPKEEKERIENNVEEALKHLESRDETPRFLKSMNKRLQFEFVKRLLSNRKPTRNDWSNSPLEKTYKFEKSWHYYSILMVLGILFLASMDYIITSIFYSDLFFSYDNLYLIISFGIMFGDLFIPFTKKFNHLETFEKFIPLILGLLFPAFIIEELINAIC